MASVCIVDVPSISVVPFHSDIKVWTPFELTRSEPPLDATEFHTPTEEECTEALLAWDADVRRSARAAAAKFHLDESYADDFAQEARIRLFNTLRRRPMVQTAYLRRVISNAVQSAVSATRRWSDHDPIDETTDDLQADPENSNTNDPLEIAAVNKFIDGLPVSLRSVYKLLYEEGRTQQEAASQVGVAQPRIAQLHKELLSRAQGDLNYLDNSAGLCFA
jgi:RNA polymerase sigma factor (sigma-70 family)